MADQVKPGDIKKVVLAYSGGLDTSVILKWLQETYRCEVVTFTADLGQGEELEPARKKAEMIGVKEIFIDDLREEFVRDFVFPMFRANALYEGQYLLGTSIARPLIAKRQIEIARRDRADAVAHGATGKGNDQVRFELAYYALAPDIKVIAPWREWDLTSRTRLLEYAEKHQIPIAKDKRGEAPFSVDANLLHISAEGKVLGGPWDEPEEYVYSRTVAPEDAPDKPAYVEIDFERGDPIAIDGERLSPARLLTRLNELGGANGIGRLDLVENRFVGMKSRGVYETPGGTILQAAHRGIESLTLDRGAMHLKDELMPRYAELIYNGFWFAPEREMLQALIDKSQEKVEGTGPAQALQGAGAGGRPAIAEQPLQPGARHLRGRPGLRPARRRGLHQPERAAPAPGGAAGSEVEPSSPQRRFDNPRRKGQDGDCSRSLSLGDARDRGRYDNLSAQLLLRFEPAECLGFKVPAPPHFGNAASPPSPQRPPGTRPGKLAVFRRRGAGVVGAADHQHRQADRRQLRHEVEVHDRGRAAEITLGRCAEDRILDLLPAPGIARLEGRRQVTVHRRLDDRRQRIGLAHRLDARAPNFNCAGRARRQGVAPQDRDQPVLMVERKGLADHPADRQADVVHARDRQPVEHRSDVAGEVLHRVVAGDRVAAAMPAHVEPQHAEPALQQRRDLLGPAAAVGGERMGDAHGRGGVGADQIVGDRASVQRQQHGELTP